MSLSKLETLPNEILIEILEKYINAIDIVKAFRFQLNQRFDSLIQQCQRFRFNFIRCHKDDFRLSMGILPAYLDHIEELALSEKNAPGQTHAFFSFFPSFNVFKGLSKLYLYVDAEAIEPRILENALHSLTETALHTISIQIIEATTLTSFDHIIAKLFRMTTLRKLSIMSSTGENRINWSSLNGFCSNIEYLTIKGFFCDFKNIKSIFQCASGLKYINMDLAVNKYFRQSTKKLTSENRLIQMSKLHTMIAKINGDTRSIQDQMDPFFKSMPSLRRLELTIDGTSVDITIWEILLKNSLPKLTHFTLECLQYSISDLDVNTINGHIHLPFWMEKKNYNIILKEYSIIEHSPFHLDSLENFTSKDSNVLVNKWYIVPRREQNGVLSTTNQISSLLLSSHSNLLIRNHYLNNVTELVINEINENLLEFLTTHVNLFQIKHLDISHLPDTIPDLSSVLSGMKSLTSLQICVKQLTNPQLTHLNDHKKLKFLDISAAPYCFNEKMISLIAKIFPYIEHLCINTSDLQNVTLLQTCIPKLRSLTFTTDELEAKRNGDDYEQKMFDITLRRRMQFLFQRKGRWLTVWLDRTAFEDASWSSYGSGSNYLIDGRRMMNNKQRYSWSSSAESDPD